MEKHHYLSSYDLLTGLANRGLLEVQFKQAIQSASANGTQLAIFVIDLDRFRYVNHNLGHQVGDYFLIFLAKKLQSYASPSCTVSRFGSDEFIIVLPEAERMAEVMAFAQGITELFREPVMNRPVELFITASIGISIYPNDGNDAGSLITKAEIAMRRAKEKGGSLTQFYHPEMAQSVKYDYVLEAELRQAIHRQELVLHYQPIVDLQSGEVYGVEALIRWERPGKSLMLPEHFLSVAEHSGLIVPIGEWVLQEACRQLGVWKNKGLGFLCMSVNVSAAQLLHPGFVGQVRKVLNETNTEPGKLSLEITDNIALNNSPYILETMNRLKGLGVRFALDDFGTGRSSLGCLKRIPFQVLKIDKSFIEDIAFNKDNAAIVTALIHMSRRMNIKTVAKGVETKEQLTFLKKEGCNFVQGYYYSRPLPAETLEQILEKKSLVD